MKETVFKPLSDLEAAIEAMDFRTLFKVVVYASHYVPPPCAGPSFYSPQPLIIGHND